MALSQQKKKLLKDEEKRLESEIRLHRYLYYNKKPRISDQGFDGLVARMTELNSENPVLSEVGAPPDEDSGWQKTIHSMPMTSLANAMTPDEFEKKFLTMTTRYNPKVSSKSYVIEDKFDGLTIELIYENGILVQAITRGNGKVGDDILINVEKMQFIKKKLKDKISASIRGEIMLFKEDFERINKTLEKPFKNPRNAASGICKRFDAEHCEDLKVVVYDILSKDKTFTWETDKMDYLSNDLGLVTANYKLTSAEDVVQIRQNYTDSIREGLPYMIDGLVIKYNSIQRQKDLGAHSNGDPKGQIAFKFDPKGVATILKNIVSEVGRTGVITPNAVLEPVNIDGSTVKAASLHNFDEIERLGVGIGDTVLVIKSGEIIPKVMEVITSAGNPMKIPTECPACGGKVLKEDATLKCLNEDCSGQEFRRLRHWIDIMKKKASLENIGESLIDQLNTTGLVRDPADFYKLTVDDISSLDRSGEKTAKKIVKGLKKCKELDDITFLTALGIPTLGSSLAELISEEYTLEQLLETVTESDLEKLEGIGDSRSADILNGIRQRKPLIDKLKELGVVIKKYEKKEAESDILAGKSFQITGTLTKINPETNKNYKRNDFNAIVESNGGEIMKVKKGLTYLVVCKASSNKISKAENLGVKAISEDDFWNILEE